MIQKARKSRAYIVSILILLDYLLLLIEEFHGEDGRPRLNPYFIGLSTLITERKVTLHIRTVSILILLDYLLL